MNLLLDTNIIVNIIRVKDFFAALNYINPDNALLYISVASQAEIKSLAIRNRWGRNRINSLNNFLDLADVAEITQLSVNTYAEIDAYSQRLNPSFESYSFETPRNMGKNDLRIASIATLLGLRLVTTDADFDHLHDVFFEVKKLSPLTFCLYLIIKLHISAILLVWFKFQSPKVFLNKAGSL